MTNPYDMAWFPIPSTLPKEAVDNINELVDLKVMEKLNNEIRFTHSFLEYYDKASHTVDRDDKVKTMIDEEYKKGGFNKEMEDLVIGRTKMEGAIRKHLEVRNIRIEDERLLSLIMDASNLMDLLDASNELRSAMYNMSKAKEE